MENIERSVDNPPSDISQNLKPDSKKYCCNFSFKKIILFFGVLLLAFVAFQFYQTRTLKPTSKITPSPTPTINISDTSTPDEIGTSWKTYTNTKYGYSIKYPEDWNINSSNPSAINLSFNIKYSSESGYPNSGASINIDSERSNLLNLEDFYKQIASNKFTKINSRSDIKIDGLDALLLNVNQLEAPPGMDVHFIKSDIHYTIQFWQIDTNQSKTFDQILSTFRFTDVSDSNSLNSNLCEIGKEYVSDNINPNPCQCSDGSKRTVVKMTWGACPTGTSLRDCPASIFKCVE